MGLSSRYEASSTGLCARGIRPVVGTCLLFGVLLFPVELLGQLTTDQVPRERTIATQEQVRRVIEKSRFRLGPFRLIPELSVTDAGYTDNVFGTSDALKQSDYYGTVTGGARWAVPAGGKFYVQGEVRPGYTWSKDFPERQSFGGLYQAALLGFFNRLSFETGGFNSRGLEYLNSETQTQVIHTLRDGSAKVEVDLFRTLSVFAGAEAQRHRYGLETTAPQVDTANLFDVSRLNRTEWVARGGMRLRIASSFDVSAAIEGNRTEFTRTSLQSDNQGSAYLLAVHYDRPRLFLNLSGGYREARPFNSSMFPRYSSPTGSYFLSYFLTKKVELQAYGDRRLTYGLFSDNPYYTENLNGGAINLTVGPHLTLRGFGEYSNNDSPRTVLLQDQFVRKTDHVTSYGGGFSTVIFLRMAFSALATESKYSSNVPGFSRSVLRLSASLTVLGD